MRFLLLLVLLFSVPVYSAELGHFSFNGISTDSSGNGYNMTVVGSPPYQPAASCYGGKTAGVFSTGNYFSNTNLSTALIASANSYYIAFDLMMNTHTTFPAYFGTSALLNFFSIYSGGGNDSKFRWLTNGNDDYSTHTFQDNTCYHIELSWNGTTKICKVNGVTEISTSNSATWAGAILYVGDGSGTTGGAGAADAYIQNMVFSSTAIATPTITPSPVPMARFTPYTVPILQPTLTWEAGNTARLSVINDGGTLRAAYWAGPYSTHPGGMIGMATSSDGYNWTRASLTPVIGDNFGGETTDAERPTLIKTGSTYIIYYQDGNGAGALSNINYATSSDGITFTKQGTTLGVTAVAQPNGGWCCMAAYNTGSSWSLMASGQSAAVDSTFSSTGGVVALAFMNRADSLNAKPATSAAIRSFIVPQSGTQNGRIENFYSAFSPYNIYHAAASDNTLTYFHADQTPVVDSYTVTNAANYGEAACNGLTDVSVIEFNGKVFMYFTVFDNTNSIHRLGVATFNGTMSSLFTNTTPTPGPSKGPNKTQDKTMSFFDPFWGSDDDAIVVKKAMSQATPTPVRSVMLNQVK